jgi:O-antigen/teichoic acid export membrane protein
MGIIIRQSIKGTIATYIGAFIGFLTTMFVVTRYLEPEEIGLTRVMLEIGLLFGGLAQLGTGSSAFKFFPYFKNRDKNHNGFFFYLVALPTIGCVLVSAVYLLLRQPITAFFAEKSALLIDYYYWILPLIWFACFLAVFEIYTTLNMRITVPRFNREVVIRLLTLVVYVLFGFQLIGRDGLVGGTVLAYGGALVVITLYMSRLCCVSLRHDTSFVSPKMRGEIFRYTAFIVTVTLSGVILGKIDLFMVSSTLGLGDAGIYTIAFFIAAVVEIPSRSISSIASPVAAEALKNGDHRKANELYQKVALHQLMAGGIIFVIVWANIDNVFAIIPNGDTYSAGKWVVLFIGISRLISITLGFGGVLITFSRYYYWSLYFTVLITVLGVASNYLLIPRFGITGAAAATALTSLVSYLVQQYIVLRKVKGQPYTRNMLRFAAVVLAALLANHVLPTLANEWADGVVRSLILAVVMAVLILALHVSDDVTGMAKKIRKKLKI